MKKGYSITTHAGLIANALWQNPELAFAGYPDSLKFFDKLFGPDDFDARHKMFLDQCSLLAERHAARQEQELLSKTTAALGLPDYLVSEKVHPLTVARSLRAKGIKAQGIKVKKRPVLLHKPSVNKVKTKTQLEPKTRLEFKLHTQASGAKAVRFSKSHIFGMVVAKQINELIAATKDEQELRAVARLLIKYFHPKLIKELVKQFGFDNSTDSMHKITHSKSLPFDDYNSNSSDTLQLIKLSTLVQSHINDLSLDSSSRIKEALAQDFREAFASKIGRAFARSLFAELNIKENIPQQGILKQELNYFLRVFMKIKINIDQSRLLNVILCY
ncbi:MAG: hypothetical protein O3C63_02545 [Cyanobacteria bacterium]|nr:hypothetical protein [Cyanobacteriota bacterium]